MKVKTFYAVGYVERWHKGSRCYGWVPAYAELSSGLEAPSSQDEASRRCAQPWRTFSEVQSECRRDGDKPVFVRWEARCG